MGPQCNGAPVPENGAQSDSYDTWSVLYNRLGADDNARRVTDYAHRVVDEMGAFTEWQARRIATVFGYNLARVEDLQPPADQSPE